jgi:hypothetical protein
MPGSHHCVVRTEFQQGVRATHIPHLNRAKSELIWLPSAVRVAEGLEAIGQPGDYIFDFLYQKRNAVKSPAQDYLD